MRHSKSTQHQVQLWSVSFDLLDGDMAQALVRVLGESERRQYDALKVPAQQQQYLVAHALLRMALSRICPMRPSAWQFEKDRFGKPFIRFPRPTSDICFNLSHTSGLVACVTSRCGDVGIDVEKADCHADLETMARHCLSDMELARWRQETTTQRCLSFYELWTLKEALMKGLGLGLSLRPSEVSFEAQSGSPESSPAWFLTTTGLGKWSFHVFTPTAEHVGAIAVRTVRLARSQVSWHYLRCEDVVQELSRMSGG